MSKKTLNQKCVFKKAGIVSIFPLPSCQSMASYATIPGCNGSSKILTTPAFLMYAKWLQKIFIVWLLAITNVAMATEATDPTAELGKILQMSSSIKADFTQEVHNKHDKHVRTSSGYMAIKKPGLFHWQITKPEPNLIVVDGKKFWNYDEELQQVTVQDIDDSYENSPVSLFLAAEIKDISKRYRVNKLRTDCFELIPKDEVDGFKRVQLTFKNDIIYKLMLVDQLDQISKIEFNNVQVNISLDIGLFKFVPPPDVDVVGGE